MQVALDPVHSVFRTMCSADGLTMGGFVSEALSCRQDFRLLAKRPGNCAVSSTSLGNVLALPECV